MAYSFDITPVPKPRMTQKDRWDPGKRATDYWAYKQKLNLLANLNHYRIKDTLDIIFYLPIPDSWPRKKKASLWKKPHQQTPDIDNLVKGFIDALTSQDANIYKITAKKIWYQKGKIEVFED